MPWLDVWDGEGAGSNSWALSERYSRLRRIAIVWVFPSFHLNVVWLYPVFKGGAACGSPGLLPALLNNAVLWFDLFTALLVS